MTKPTPRPWTEDAVQYTCPAHGHTVDGLGREPWLRMLDHVTAHGCRLGAISESRTIAVKRTCNGCGERIGDATKVETECAVQGRSLPDARRDCPNCWASVDGVTDYGAWVTRDGLDVRIRLVPTVVPGEFLAVNDDRSLYLAHPDAVLRIEGGDERHRYTVLFDWKNINAEEYSR